MKYVGDTCTGCWEFRSYVKKIEHIDPTVKPICHSCRSLIPDYIPKDQTEKYLKEKYEM